MDLGSQYSMSAFRTFNYMRGGDLEAGATPDYDITMKNDDGSTDYTNFRDFAMLNDIINKHYASKNANSGREGTSTKVPKVPKTGDSLIDFILQLFL